MLGIVAGVFGVGEGGCQGVPAELVQDGVVEFGQGGVQGSGVVAAQGRGGAAATFAQHREGFNGCLPVGSSQVLGGLSGSFGLLGVPVRGGTGEEDQHVEDHRGAGSVLAPAERGPAVDEVAGRAAQVLQPQPLPG
ncbi:hypothetical protein ACWCV5_25155 [Streptomyces tubercidicus]